MNADPTWPAVKRVLGELSELCPTQREARLSDLESLEPYLARRARALLEQQGLADAEDFLVPVSEDPGRYLPELAALPAGSRVGPYQVEGVHAVGGASVVYAARQDAPARRVALKVLVPGQRREETLARFEVEKALLARLAHPGIAEVYGAATAEEARQGAPWIALEWVEGARTLVEYARDEGLNHRRRIELFRDVCDAVQHGHVRGVVHRDLKPQNVLVDHGGRVRVIDFGIARVLDESAADTITRHGDFLGTLAYMSPEQLAGDRDAVDTRCDVYALGVVLYELLCGRRPFELESESITGAMRCVLETAPTRPSKLAPGIHRDLEAVLLKALAREPGRRYSNAGELGADLGRRLARQPVVARPPSLVEVCWFALRQHRTKATACAGLALTLTVAVLGGLWHFVETRRVEAAERDKLETTTEFLSAILQLASVETSDGPSLPREVLDHVSRTLDDKLPDEARADLHLTLGATWLALGENERACSHFDMAYELQLEVHGPRAQWAPCALDMKGEALIRAGKPREALGVLEKAYVMYTSDPQHRPFMSAMAAHKRAKAHLALEEWAAAESWASEAFEVYRRTFGELSEATLAARSALEDARLSKVVGG
ncbi:MAG: serine/threonine-protein kinase [Planctomycetota bacterium]|nr:serine/threonine-protein kinase [Planctomycetota bacterium]